MAVRKSMGYAVIKKFLLIPKAKNSYIPLPINKTAKTQRRCSHGNYSLRNEDLKTRLLFLYVTAAMADATFFFPPPPPHLASLRISGIYVRIETQFSPGISSTAVSAQTVY
jgi:hypothetical protein